MDLYLAIVVIMLVLAVAGLVVGVSNDAVNFLNSALGSKAAPRYVIMTVASVGIIVGAITSSGMMEVARSGVFHPQMFTFAEVMLLFLAVMFTNVIRYRSIRFRFKCISGSCEKPLSRPSLPAVIPVISRTLAACPFQIRQQK